MCPVRTVEARRIVSHRGGAPPPAGSTMRRTDGLVAGSEDDKISGRQRLPRLIAMKRRALGTTRSSTFRRTTNSLPISRSRRTPARSPGVGSRNADQRRARLISMELRPFYATLFNRRFCRNGCPVRHLLEDAPETGRPQGSSSYGTRNAMGATE